MRFAVYHPWVYLRGGAEKILVEVLERSSHDWTIYTHHHDAAATFEELRGPEVVELAPRVSVRRSFGPLVHAATTIGRAQLPDDGAQGLLVSSEGLGDLVLARNELPAVAYCLTPLKILHDPVTRATLRQRDPRKALALKVLGGPFQQVDKALWKRYERVLVTSQEVRQRVLLGGLAPDELVEVLNPGVDPDHFALTAAEAAELDMTQPAKPFFLVAGRIMWQKNIELAIDALAALRQQGCDARLVIAGTVDEKSKPYLQTLQALAAGLPVEFEINVTGARMRELYTTAAALLFTPPNEDWGIVPLEAMACGTPVLAVDGGGPRESILHGETGWLLPNSAEAFAWQMNAVAVSAIGRPSELLRMGEACRRRASEFTWERFVNRIDEVMAEVADKRSVAVRPTAPSEAPRGAKPPQPIAARSSQPASVQVLGVG